MEIAPGPLLRRYGLPPAETEALALERVDAAVGPLSQWPGPEREIVRRIAAATGDAGVASLLRFHPEAVRAGLSAAHSGAPIVVDVRMLAVALDRAAIERLGCTVHCAIDAPEVAALAEAKGMTRAAVAMASLADRIEGSLAVVGTAPTALLTLLDLVDAGAARPALIVGTPVGFVAAESAKAELMARSVPYITVTGTRGGVAIAAAAVNALLHLSLSTEG